jgi:hypothetical protein
MKRDLLLIAIYAGFTIYMIQLTKLHYEFQDELTEKFHKELLAVQGVDTGKEDSSQVDAE